MNITEVWLNGHRIQQWDDNTRTYTEWDETGTVTLTRPYNDDENAKADEEAAQNAQITDLATRVQKLEDYVFGQLPPTTTPTPWSSGDAVAPGAVITFTDGKNYKNISGAWLVVGPDVYAIGWSLQGAPVSAWATGVSYKTGDQVSYQGSTYQCLQAHTSQAGWEPTNAPSLWQKL